MDFLYFRKIILIILIQFTRGMILLGQVVPVSGQVVPVSSLGGI